MSKGGFQNPKYANQSGTTSGYGSQGNFGMGYTQPYGSPGAGTYDPMLGFGQASGMGTTYNYPTRYTADYTRYAQSGQPFNPAVMGYNSYGQIFAQPQRPPPSMGKGGGGFQPQPPAGGGKGRVGTPRVPRGGTGNFLDFYTRQNNPANSIFEPGSQPPTMGGKGGPQPINDNVTISYPGGSRTFPRNPQRRSNQLGLTGGPGATPPPLTGGVPNDFTVGPESPRPVIFPQRDRNLNPAAGRGPPGDNTDYRPVESNFVGILPTDGLNNDVRVGPSNPYTDDLVMSPVRADRQIIDENIYNSPFGQLIQAKRPSEYDTAVNTFVGSVMQANPGMTQDRARQLAEGRYESLKPTETEMIRPAESQPTYPSFVDSYGGMFSPNFGAMQFQEGGQVPPDAASNMELMLSEAGPANPQAEMAGEYDRLIQMTMQAVLGQTENADEIIQMFIDEFGVDAFRQLRDAVLKQQVPNAQTEGMVDGNGGGMDDQVMGMIGNQRPVAVSPGEYIVPADVVSGLGDGSSKAGADMLDELNQAVRMARTGTAEQPRPLMETLQ